MDFDRNLGCYPLANHTQWTTQVDYISEKVLERLQPVNRVILSEQKEHEMRQAEDKAATGGSA